MEMEEQFVSHIAQRVLKERSAELKSLDRDLSKLENIKPPFPRISYDDAAKMLEELYEKETDPEKKELLKFDWGIDFGAPHETAITQQFDKPVFVYGYPTKVKAFYMEPWPNRPEVCKSVDLLAPEGYGEICGGSERIYRAEMQSAVFELLGIEEQEAEIIQQKELITLNFPVSTTSTQAA